MTSSDDAVTVIIPTLAIRERAGMLERSIGSVLGQENVHAMPLVVVNGDEWDAQLVEAMKRDSRIRVIEADKANLPAALRLGRSHVETTWIAALDDDDVLLPGALLARTRALKERPDCVAVVTNALRRDHSGDTLHMPDFTEVRRDPLRSMLKFNWLVPGSWLGRTVAFDDELFRRMPRYLECTYLGIRFSTSHRTCFLDVPTVAWSTDTPRSVSKSREYRLGATGALSRILELDLPVDVRQGLRKKLAEAHHTKARVYLQERNLRAAWDSHLRSLRGPASWRFLSFTLRFCLPQEVQ